IPLVSYPQRGGRLQLSFFLRYNGKAWSQTNGNPPGPEVFSSLVGVDVARDQVTEARAIKFVGSAPVTGDNRNDPVKGTVFTVVTADGSSHVTGAMIFQATQFRIFRAVR